MLVVSATFELKEFNEAFLKRYIPYEKTLVKIEELKNLGKVI